MLKIILAGFLASAFLTSVTARADEPAGEKADKGKKEKKEKKEKKDEKAEKPAGGGW